MIDHAERADELFLSGYNCAKSVFCDYCDLTGIELKQAIRLSASFGGGMGRLREVCVGVSGGIMVLRCLLAPDAPADQNLKALHYARVQELAGMFQSRHGTILCRDLLGNLAGEGYVPEARTKEYYQKRPCGRLVWDGAKNLEKMLISLGAVNLK